MEEVEITQEQFKEIDFNQIYSIHLKNGIIILVQGKAKFGYDYPNEGDFIQEDFIQKRIINDYGEEITQEQSNQLSSRAILGRMNEIPPVSPFDFRPIFPNPNPILKHPNVPKHIIYPKAPLRQGVPLEYSKSFISKPKMPVARPPLSHKQAIRTVEVPRMAGHELDPVTVPEIPVKPIPLVKPGFIPIGPSGVPVRLVTHGPEPLKEEEQEGEREEYAKNEYNEYEEQSQEKNDEIHLGEKSLIAPIVPSHPVAIGMKPRIISEESSPSPVMIPIPPKRKPVIGYKTFQHEGFRPRPLPVPLPLNTTLQPTAYGIPQE